MLQLDLFIPVIVKPGSVAYTAIEKEKVFLQDALGMFIMQVLASQLFLILTNKNAELSVSPLFWPETA